MSDTWGVDVALDDSDALDSGAVARIDVAERGVPSGIPSPANLIEDEVLCVLVYARISDLSGKRGDPEKRLDGITNQHAAGRRIARRENLMVVKRYTDNDRSASKGDYRPDFESMLTDLHRGCTREGYRVHGVIAVDEDRIYKTPEQWDRFIAAFRSFPDRVFADYSGMRDLYEEDAEDVGLRSVAISMGENRKCKARVRRWHEEQARRGIAHTGGRVFGYRPVIAQPGKIEVVPREADVIRLAVGACVEGQSLASIVRLFQASGLKTEKGGPWRRQTVKQIISSPRNAGLRILGEELDLLRDDNGHPVIGEWEAIISTGDWESVAARYPPRNRRARTDAPPDAKAGSARKYLCSGLLRCGKTVDGRLCNGVMIGFSTEKDSRSKSKYRYSCRSSADGGCGGVSVAGEWIDKAVSDAVLGMLESRPVIERETWAGEAELSDAIRRRDAFEVRWSSGEESDDRFYRLSPLLDQNVDALRKAKAEYERAHALSVDFVTDCRERWSEPVSAGGYDLDRKRSIILAEVSAVLVYPVGKGTQKRPHSSIRMITTMAGHAGS
ncbi:recombinase family protein [Nocardia sp. NPDC058480]|uniref:recombinase family protein n=1 Tax=unclassified Nocardia TaxID=2637762 RepID=UPI00366471C4